MAGMAIAMLTLLIGAIYSLSHLTTAPWARPLEAPQISPEPPHQVPTFAFKDETGHLIDPSRLEGHWTLMTFWSYGCPPCMLELPGLNTFLLSWQGPQFEVLTVNTDEDRSDNLEQARAFLLEQQITLPTIFDTQGVVRKAFDVTEYPRHFMINPEGQITWAASGAFNWNDASTKDQILKMMEQSSPGTRPDLAE